MSEDDKADYKIFQNALDAMQEDLSLAGNNDEEIVKRLAILTTFFTANWSEFWQDHFVDICKHIQSKYRGKEDESIKSRTTH